LRPGKDALIIGYGPVLLPQAWQAAELMRQRHGLEVAVVNLPWLSRIDPDWLRRAVDGRRAVFTLDNHLVKGGQGRMIAATIAELSLERAPLVRRFGLTDFPVCGQNSEVLQASGLDADSLATTMAGTLLSKRAVAAQ
jgi:transketolase